MSHSPVLAAPSNPPTKPKTKPFDHPIPKFHPNLWGNRFLDYIPEEDCKVIEAQQEQAKSLKEKIKRELLSVGEKPVLMEKLCLIDSIERLGIAYHFEKEIREVLKCIHEMNTTDSDNLFLTSLRFRLLRQNGFKVSCDVFKRFVGSNVSLKQDTVACDVQGMLSLYEASHVRGHGETILDEALTFTTSKLKSIYEQLSYPLKEHIDHALKMALHKGLTRLESVHYMQVYEQDPWHNKTLLQFAKLDFNLLQSCHKKELSDMCRWWKSIDIVSELPLRDRIVECYFWGSALYFEPQYSIGRKICTMGSEIITSMDDIYDSYGTLEELEIFTKAIVRWDKSCLDELPENLRRSYQTLLLDAFEEMERDLAMKGRSEYVYYAREEMKSLCKAYLVEARWRHKKYIPTFDEFLEIAFRNSAIVATVIFTFLDMDMATHDEFEWVRKVPKPVEAVCLLLRFLDDVGGNKFDQTRGHTPLSISSYMKQYSVSNEQACKKLYKRTNELWKDMNQAIIPPTEIPMPLLMRILNLGRSIEVVYDGGEDGFTTVNKSMKENIRSLYIDPIPI